jgi:hypothetical protein
MSPGVSPLMTGSKVMVREKDKVRAQLEADLKLAEASGLNWTEEQAAAFLEVSQSWLNKAARRGEVPSVKVGRRREYPPAKVKAFRSGDWVPPVGALRQKRS